MPIFKTKRGIGLFYEYAPRKRKPVIVFVHGLATDHNFWDYYIHSLGNDCGILAYDIKGHGQSSMPDETAEYRVPVLADELAELVKGLKIKSFYMVGHSIGGMIASEYVARYKPKCLGVALLVTPVSFADVNKTFFRLAKAALLIPKGFYEAAYKSGLLFFSRILQIYVRTIARADADIALKIVGNLKNYGGLKKMEITPLVVIASKDEMINSSIAKMYPECHYVKDRHPLAFSREKIVSLIKEYIQKR